MARTVAGDRPRLRSVRSSCLLPKGGSPFRDRRCFRTGIATTGRYRSSSAPHSGPARRGYRRSRPLLSLYYFLRDSGAQDTDRCAARTKSAPPYLCSGKWTLRYRATNFATAMRRPSGVVGSRRTRSRKSIGIRLASSARATARASRCRASRAIVARFREPFGRPAPFRKPPCFATILIS